MTLTNSPMHSLSIWGKEVFIKRDDLLHPYLNGNKARKFYLLFAHPNPLIKSIVSYGGAQSNAMLSLAWLARLKQWHFTYYTKSLPTHLKENPSGNLLEALQQGMKLIEIPHNAFMSHIEEITSQDFGEDELLIKQGGADTYAEAGLRILAEELNHFVSEKRLEHANVILSSGTGASALYLNRHLNDQCKLYTVACVGGSDYLRHQWENLENDNRVFPHILEGIEKIPFAKPKKSVYLIYRELLEAGMEFDLLYDSVTWLALQKHWETLFRKSPLIFIHTGGTCGNRSQLERYHYLGIAP